jgi:hypothetical protein
MRHPAILPNKYIMIMRISITLRSRPGFMVLEHLPMEFYTLMGFAYGVHKTRFGELESPVNCKQESFKTLLSHNILSEIEVTVLEPSTLPSLAVNTAPYNTNQANKQTNSLSKILHTQSSNVCTNKPPPRWLPTQQSRRQTKWQCRKWNCKRELW